MKKDKPAEPNDTSMLTSRLQDVITREGEEGGEGGEGGIIDPPPETLPPPEEAVEPPVDIPVSPSDLAHLGLGTVVRFGSAVLRVGAIDTTAGTVRFLRELGDPESFYTATELRILILLRPIPGSQEYEPWPRVVALTPQPPPVTP